MMGSGRVWFNYGFPVSSAVHHHPTHEPKTVTTGRYYLGQWKDKRCREKQLGSGNDVLCDLNPVISPPEPVSNICKMG